MSDTRALLTVLPDRGVVAVTGADALPFLDNLVTNDLSSMGDGDARFAALLSPQGKILFEFFVVRAEHGLWLDVDRASAAALAKRLAMYKLRAKVDIEDVSSRSAVAAAWWLPVGTRPTSFSYSAKVRASFADPRDPRLGLRIMIEAPETGAPISDVSGMTTVDAAQYTALRIMLSTPQAGADYDLGDTFPHEANYDRLHGVSFSKGCYVGQEVVARMQNKTVVRKRMLRVTGAGLRTGGELKIGETAIGRIGSVDGGTALAMLRLDRASEALATGQVIAADGQEVTCDPDVLQRYRSSVASQHKSDL